ncbi:MAG: GNAT family N-acetyltransferase [Puia sp.]
MDQLNIRQILAADNALLAEIIRKILTEFGANKPGTVYFDPTTDNLFELFSASGSAYFVAEVNGKIAGGAGVFPTPDLPTGCCELVKLYLLHEVRGRGLGSDINGKMFSAGRNIRIQPNVPGNHA